MTARRTRPSLRRIVQKTALWTTILLTILWVGSGWFRWHSRPPDNAWIGIAGGRFIGGCRGPSLPTLPALRHANPPIFGTSFGTSYDPSRDTSDKPFLAFLDASVDLILDTRKPPRHLVAPFSWSSGPYGFVVAIPIWLPVALASIATALLYRKDMIAARRRSRGHCPMCDYDRAGLAPNTPCPECGQAP